MREIGTRDILVSRIYFRLLISNFYTTKMSMRSTIESFAKQFEYEPVIRNGRHFESKKTAIVAGMGGSGLAGSLVRMLHPERLIYVHEDYGLPPLPHVILKNSLYIGYSYSGNTEETLRSLALAQKDGYAVAAVSTGGKLLQYAQQHGIPFIRLPEMQIQPRAALGVSVRALLAFLGEKKTLATTRALADRFTPSDFIDQAEALARALRGSVPVVYASTRNGPLAYSWKIKFNETAKIPAFSNVVPELNHNEMNGYDVVRRTRELSRRFHFIFLRDSEDHPRIQRRMEVMARLYKNRRLTVSIVDIEGKSAVEKMFSTLVCADWTALLLGEYYGVETEQVPMVEEFKKQIAS